MMMNFDDDDDDDDDDDRQYLWDKAIKYCLALMAVMWSRP